MFKDIQKPIGGQLGKELQQIQQQLSAYQHNQQQLLLAQQQLQQAAHNVQQLAQQLALDRQLYQQLQKELKHNDEERQQLQQQWQQCTDARRPLSVIIIDIDFFKQFNDRYGHIQGDACLRKVAGAIVQAMPVDAKLAARYGGEEFALILPNHNEISALKVAREVQQAMRQLSFVDAGLPSTLAVTVSQGVATEINGQYRTAMALLCAADTALYRAKADGRDCINASS